MLFRSPYVSFESLIVLGDAVIAATSKQPVLAKDRDAAAIYQDLVKFVERFIKMHFSLGLSLSDLMSVSNKPKINRFL